MFGAGQYWSTKKVMNIFAKYLKILYSLIQYMHFIHFLSILDYFQVRPLKKKTFYVCIPKNILCAQTQKCFLNRYNKCFLL